MSDPGEASDLVRRTIEEHHESMLVVAEVEAILDRHPDREWVRDLAEALPRLGATMRAHFRGEEQGPLFRKLPETHPQLAGRLDALEREHGRMLKEISRATAAAEALCDAAEPHETHELRELNALVQLLVAKLHRHEAQENELVMEAHWSEVGVGD